MRRRSILAAGFLLALGLGTMGCGTSDGEPDDYATNDGYTGTTQKTKTVSTASASGVSFRINQG